jgi:hypothetical protein
MQSKVYVGAKLHAIDKIAYYTQIYWLNGIKDTKNRLRHVVDVFTAQSTLHASRL